MMDIQEFAKMLDGREYLHEMTKDEEKLAKALGFVVIFGYSDDNAELRGAINDEVGCFDGGILYFNSNGLIQNECDNEDCPYYKKQLESAKTIEAIWSRGEFAWEYDTNIPHATFDIYDNGEPFCRGIVFDIKELAKTGAVM